MGRLRGGEPQVSGLRLEEGEKRVSQYSLPAQWPWAMLKDALVQVIDDGYYCMCIAAANDRKGRTKKRKRGRETYGASCSSVNRREREGTG
jgi:hypothetical protein